MGAAFGWEQLLPFLRQGYGRNCQTGGPSTEKFPSCIIRNFDTSSSTELGLHRVVSTHQPSWPTNKRAKQQSRCLPTTRPPRSGHGALCGTCAVWRAPQPHNPCDLELVAVTPHSRLLFLPVHSFNIPLERLSNGPDNRPRRAHSP